LTYLADTNVVSELARATPAASVLRWLNEAQYQSIHMSVLSLGELRKGVERLPDGSRKEQLRRWLEDHIQLWFGNRILPVSAGVADRWGRLMAEQRRTLPTIDSLLAATALHHDLRLVTRNTADFNYPGLAVVNPWETRA
jgi:hypothetical protein